MKKQLLLLIILLISSSIATAVPPLPTEFYGKAKFFNNPAAIGTQIRAYDSNGDLCGIFTITKLGFYGTLSCSGRDTLGNGIGPVQNEEITLRISTYPTSMLYGETANTLITPTYQAGSFKQINLVVPPLVCGDGFCDIAEGCAFCPQDCGTCPIGGGNGSSGGGGSGGSGGAGGGVQQPRPITSEFEEETCSESWMCSEWTECAPIGIRTRECVDLNECKTTEFKPELEEECTYKEPLKTEETSITPTTPDTKREERPGIIQPCNEKLSILSFPSILFIALFLFITAISLGRLHHNITKIRKDKKLKEIEKLEKEFHLKKETFIFLITITVIAIIVYLYHYYFFICKTNYINHLWLLAIFIVLSPVIINFFIELMKYHEDEKLAKTVLLYDSHYNHYLNLLNISENRIGELEENIIKYTSQLDESSDFYKLLTEISELRHAYKEINKLYLLYREGKQSTRMEKKLTEDLDIISKNKEFSDAADKHPELKTLYQDMIILFKAFQEKQEILDSLRKIEEEYEQFGSNSEGNEIKNEETKANTEAKPEAIKKTFEDMSKEPEKH